MYYTSRTKIIVVVRCITKLSYRMYYRPISQAVFMLSIAVNRALFATIIMTPNYMLMCNRKIFINIMLSLLNSTVHIICKSRFIVDFPIYDDT